MRKRQFGTVRRLPSGKWQVRYRVGNRVVTAPDTFTTKGDASRYLAVVETDMARGVFVDPGGGRVMLADWDFTTPPRRSDPGRPGDSPPPASPAAANHHERQSNSNCDETAVLGDGCGAGHGRPGSELSGGRAAEEAVQRPSEQHGLDDIGQSGGYQRRDHPSSQAATRYRPREGGGPVADEGGDEDRQVARRPPLPEPPPVPPLRQPPGGSRLSAVVAVGEVGDARDAAEDGGRDDEQHGDSSGPSGPRRVREPSPSAKHRGERNERFADAEYGRVARLDPGGRPARQQT